MRGLLALLLLLGSNDPPRSPAPDAGVRAPEARSAEDEEVVRNLDLLEHLAETQALDLLLELEQDGSKTAR